MSVDLLTAGTGLFSFLVFLLVQIIVFRKVQPEQLLRSLLICVFGVMGLPVVLIAIIHAYYSTDLTVTAWITAALLSSFLQGLLSFVYVLCFFGPFETSVRMRLVREIAMAGEVGLSASELDKMYSNKTVVDLRLKRLSGSGDIVEANGTYRLGSSRNIFFIFDSISGILKKCIAKQKPPRKWPKVLPPLTDQQKVISDDFMKYWLSVMPKNLGFFDKFNHLYVVKAAPKGFLRTLDIGTGVGEHLKYEILDQTQMDNYVALDSRENMIAQFQAAHPGIKTIVADCQKHLDFEDDHFDRIIAVHVLEHLPDLPSAVREMHRLCHKEHGVLSIVFPCEGSLLYSLIRKVTAQRMFEARYKQSYRWFIEREHINLPYEIFNEMSEYFLLESTAYYPFPIKIEFCNLFIGATFRPRTDR